jgi:hypothetical protein
LWGILSRRVGFSTRPQTPPDRSQRHGLDTSYNFFERSAWTTCGLAYHLAVLILTRLRLFVRITLLVDDTLAHERSQKVWGLGWWRDAVANTKKRTASASGSCGSGWGNGTVSGRCVLCLSCCGERL